MPRHSRKKSRNRAHDVADDHKDDVTEDVIEEIEEFNEDGIEPATQADEIEATQQPDDDSDDLTPSHPIIDIALKKKSKKKRKERKYKGMEKLQESLFPLEGDITKIKKKKSRRVHLHTKGEASGASVATEPHPAYVPEHKADLEPTIDAQAAAAPDHMTSPPTSSAPPNNAPYLYAEPSSQSPATPAHQVQPTNLEARLAAAETTTPVTPASHHGDANVASPFRAHVVKQELTDAQKVQIERNRLRAQQLALRKRQADSDDVILKTGPHAITADHQLKTITIPPILAKDIVVDPTSHGTLAAQSEDIDAVCLQALESVERGDVKPTIGPSPTAAPRVSLPQGALLQLRDNFRTFATAGEAQMWQRETQACMEIHHGHCRRCNRGGKPPHFGYRPDGMVAFCRTCGTAQVCPQCHRDNQDTNIPANRFYWDNRYCARCIRRPVVHSMRHGDVCQSCYRRFVCPDCRLVGNVHLNLPLDRGSNAFPDNRN